MKICLHNDRIRGSETVDSGVINRVTFSIVFYSLFYQIKESKQKSSFSIVINLRVIKVVSHIERRESFNLPIFLSSFKVLGRHEDPIVIFNPAEASHFNLHNTIINHHDSFLEFFLEYSLVDGVIQEGSVSTVGW